MSKIRFFRYSGSKFKYTEIVNKQINKSSKSIYVEPFVGSGAILFNLEKKFKKYIINDIDKNIINIYRTFKEIDYNFYVEKRKLISEKFGEFKNHKNAKENYYNFRNWFNETWYGTNTIDEGIYLYFLSNMVINSLLRFGPNGMNQSFGNRFYEISENDFSRVKDILQKTEIHNTSYKNIFELYPDAVYFLDPPYFSRDSSYKSFSENDFLEFLELLKDKEYVYTDILNEHNQSIENKQLIREMKNTAPSSNKQKRGDMEYLFSPLLNISTDW